MSKRRIWLPAFFAILVAVFLSCGADTRDRDRDDDRDDDRDEGRVDWPSISLLPYAGGLIQPTDVQSAGDGSGRLFVAERGGTIRIVRNGAVLAVPFLDISSLVTTSGSEQGLLGIAFPPSFSSSRRFYVNYTRVSDGATVVARYTVSSSNTDRADPTTARVIFTQPQPYSNHNGGQITFGPDGFLYIGMGDGGSGGDPQGNAQNSGVLLGKLLRIDTEGGASTYAIPAGNPYGNEVWALGLRNPWKFSFDRGSDALYIADVGQDSYEEVNYVSSYATAGVNYGWNIMEGSHCYGADSCNRSGLTLPVKEYENSGDDCSVTGGYVYRGNVYSSMRGFYFFGDYCSGRIRAIKREDSEWQSSVLMDTSLNISTFGLDEQGELYVAGYSTGNLYRIVGQ